MRDSWSRRRFLQQSRATALALFPALIRAEASPARSSASLKKSAGDAWIDDLRRSVPEAMQRADVPGLSLAVIRNARVSWNQGFGVRSKATGEPVTTGTIFEAASLSKPTFAYAV